MTPDKLEEYLLGKPNVRKRIIPEWNYIRYTVLDTPFASVAQTEKGVVLTVLGRFEQYEREYPSAVMPAVNNEPRFYSSVLLSEGSVPDRVIKAMADYSYDRIVKSVPMPELSESGCDDIPYVGISSVYYEGAPKPSYETAATYSVVEKGCKDSWSKVSYNVLSDEKAISSLINLTKNGKLK